MKKVREDFVVKVDGIGLYARRFGNLSKEEAVKQMEADGISNDKKWSESAYATLKKEIDKRDAELDKKEEEAGKVIEAEKAKQPEAPKPSFLRNKEDNVGGKPEGSGNI